MFSDWFGLYFHPLGFFLYLVLDFRNRQAVFVLILVGTYWTALLFPATQIPRLELLRRFFRKTAISLNSNSA